MKKVFSYFFFVLMIALFLYELYFSIAAAIDVRANYAAFLESGDSGHRLLGVGWDVLIIFDILFSVAGLVLSGISFLMAQNRVVRISSAIGCPLFFLPILVSVIIVTA